MPGRFFRLLLVLCAAFPLHAHGEGWTLDTGRTGLGKFALGLFGGIVAHEAGHYVVATSKGYDVGFDGLSIVYPGAVFTDADHLQVASAGFQTQWLLAELALRDSTGGEMLQPTGDFGAGIVCAHLAITAAYVVYLKDHRLGDVVGMADATGYSNNQIMLALAVPGVLDAWRLFGNAVPAWVPQLSLLGKGAGIAWAWSY
ncbi:MAG TPA: hypothetical protein VGD24_01080 [Gallionella sp.]